MNPIASVLLTAAGLLFPSGGSNEPANDHDTFVLKLELNDGQKWQVDEHTRASVGAMTRLIVEASPIHSVEDARTLAAAFDVELKNLIQGCTMTGPAHDQLHLVLAALFPRVQTLKVKTERAELQETQREIRSIFEAYEAAFQ